MLNQELMEKYRKVFGSPMGQDVLADILTMTHFGETLDANNLHRVAEHNLGILILVKMGVFSNDTKMDVIRALQSITPSKAEKQGGTKK